MKYFIPHAALAATFAFTFWGCERKTVVIETPPTTPIVEPVPKTKTLETTRLGAAVDSYERSPSAEKLADVKKALADLDGEIAELEALVAKRTGTERDEAATKLRNLQAYRTAETARFTAAQVKAGIVPEGDGRSGGQKIEEGTKKAGEEIRDGAEKAADAIKDGAEKAKDAIKDATK